jgi:hypothetical protein
LVLLDQVHVHQRPRRVRSDAQVRAGEFRYGLLDLSSEGHDTLDHHAKVLFLVQIQRFETFMFADTQRSSGTQKVRNILHLFESHI